MTGTRALESEVAQRADFSKIRYAQCWEDADVLLGALELRPGAECLSIASAGDNTLSLLAGGAGRVVALDLNPSQLACLALRVAAYRELEHGELLELMGSRESVRRMALYRRCRGQLTARERWFWDSRSEEVEGGIGAAGKFERYFALFRRRVLPLVHGRRRVERLLAGGDREERERFYREEWDTWRWRAVFQVFFSRLVMGRVGRDPSFFRYVEGSVAGRIMRRAEHAAVELDPAENPYLHWILTGRHGEVLPHALRLENFEKIRGNLDRLEWYCEPLEGYLGRVEGEKFDGFNLSDIFEYMSEERFHELLERLADCARGGARMAWWSTLVERRRPERMGGRFRSLTELAGRLHAADRAFFYGAFEVEEVGL